MPKKETNEPNKVLAVGGVLVVGGIVVASLLYALTWPIRVGSMALWCVLFANSMIPDPKDQVKNFTLKIVLLIIFVGGSVVPGLLIPTIVKKALLVMSILPQVHMLIMLRAAAAAQENDMKKKKDPHAQTANAVFAKGVICYTGFTLLSLLITAYSILSD